MNLHGVLYDLIINQFKNKINELAWNEDENKVIKNIDQESFTLDKAFNKKFNLFTMIVENETRISKINDDLEEKYKVVERVEKVRNTYLCFTLINPIKFKYFKIFIFLS